MAKETTKREKFKKITSIGRSCRTRNKAKRHKRRKPYRGQG